MKSQNNFLIITTFKNNNKMKEFKMRKGKKTLNIKWKIQKIINKDTICKYNLKKLKTLS